MREGQKSPSHGQETKLEEGIVDPQTVSTQLKSQHPSECTGPHKKVKASKLSTDPITLAKGDLHNIGETVHDVTSEALQNFVQENQIVLGSSKRSCRSCKCALLRLVPFQLAT